MSLVRTNVIANLVGSASVAILSFAFVPIYIHFLGIEAFGLVGFYATMQAVFQLLDLGLKATVSRELAKLSVDEGSDQRMRNLVSTLELVYLVLAASIMIIVVGIAGPIAERWLDASTLSLVNVRQAVIAMGVVIAVRLPQGLYLGGLQGLQRHVLLNSVRVFITLLGSGGAAAVLWLLSPTVNAMFTWLACVGLLGIYLMRMALWQSLPANRKGRVQMSALREIWKFAAGMSFVSVLSVILVQMDKIVLSKILSLEQFAYYALASSVSMALYFIISPIFSALYPRLTQLVAGSNDAELRSIYHTGCQVMTILVAPSAITLSVFSIEILQLWTQNSLVAEQSGPILCILIIGTALNGMMNMPYALQLAHGWTRLAIYSNVITVTLLVPMLLYMVDRHGGVGAAYVWLILNIAYLAFNAQITHSLFLRGDISKWLFFDVVFPSCTVIVVVMTFSALMPLDLGQIGQVAWIFLTLLASTICCIIAAPEIRIQLQGSINGLFSAARS